MAKITRQDIDRVDSYTDLLSKYAYEFLSETSPDDCLYRMDEFEELMSSSVHSEGLLWLARRIFHGDFNPNHDYFYFDGYGNLESTNDDIEYYESQVNEEDDFIDYLINNGYINEYDFLEEEEEEYDEDEE